ncbi:M56 family metallopeptidase [Paenibacillus sp. SAF-054]|uniref:M56 family metallopeptidase n=1 Tax=unclassified Paenibacillus TaxID=185978 RepID=UPI003F7E0F49
MAEILSNPSLNVFFDWIIKTTVFASVMILLILIIKVILNDRLKPGWHYLLWLLLLLRLIIPAGPQSSFSIYNLFPWAGSASNNTAHVSTHTGFGEPAASDQPVSLDAVPSTEVPGPVITSEGGSGEASWNAKKAFIALWLMGTGAMLIRLPLSHALFSIRLRRRLIAASPAEVSLLEKAQRTMDIRRHVRLSFSPLVSTPTLFGWIRPRLMMPLSSLELDDVRKHHIYMHELAHMKHADILVNWFMQILLALHWFNPLLWYGIYKMREDQELAADASALRNIDSAGISDYGHTIITLLENNRLHRSIPGAAGLSGSKQQLKRRILMIKTFRHKSMGWTVAGLALVLALSGCALTNGTTANDNSESTPSVTTPSVTTPSQEAVPETPENDGAEDGGGASQDGMDHSNGAASNDASGGGKSSDSGASSGIKEQPSSGSKVTRGHEQQIQDIYALAKKGKVKGADFVSGKTTIDVVHKLWGDPDRPWQPNDAYAYDTYSPGAGRGSYAFGIGRGEVVYDIRYFGPGADESTAFRQISLAEIKQTLGKPSSIKTSGGDDILNYKVGEYELKFVGPQKTGRLDHISVYSPRAAATPSDIK